jgi:hypothetical protein
MEDKLSRKRVRSFAKKVQPIYEHLDWKLLHSWGKMKVPDEDKIIETIDQLYRHLDVSEDSDQTYVASGGIKLSVNKEIEDDVKVEIEMTIPERQTS